MREQATRAPQGPFRRPGRFKLALGLAILGAGSLAAGAAFLRGSKVRSSVEPGARTKVVRPNPRLRFEPNRGQLDQPVRFAARGSGYGLYLTRQGAKLVLQRAQLDARERRTARERLLPDSTPPPRPAVVSMGVVGARPVEPTGEYLLPGKSNYFVGDPSRWKSGIEGYARVRYPQVRSGVDLVFYPTGQRQLEYDLVLAPGVDPAGLALAFEGMESVEVDAAGTAVLRLPGGGELRQPPPVAYQEDGAGQRVLVAAHYQRHPGGALGFAVGEHDRRRPLVIDPVLTYSTYLGGEDDDVAYAIAVDASGSAYVLGQTRSTSFPLASPIQGNREGVFDLFVTKLDPAGSTIVYSTYLGGRATEFAGGIAVDGSGSAYVSGYTSSDNFPMAAPLKATKTLGWGAFVTKLSPSGTALVYSTYLGGTQADGMFGGDFAHDIAVDAAGSAYVVGHTQAIDLPTVKAVQPTYAGGTDAFITKLNPAGSALVFSTYLGGASGDSLNSVAVDAAGAVYVTGSTDSIDLPTVSPLQPTHAGELDGFVAKLIPSGSALAYSTYLGGDLSEWSTGIAVDAAGSAYVNGYTQSRNFPVASPMQATPVHPNDAFVSKLSPDGSALVYSTYLGTNSQESSSGIAVDTLGHAYVAGATYSLSFSEVWVHRLNPAGSALTSTQILDGSGHHDWAWGIALDPQGNAYVAGETNSVDFPTVSPLQPASAGMADAFVAKIELLPIGHACSPTDACKSGFCVDGVCCQSACGGDDRTDCQACSVAAGSSANGTCGPVGDGRACRFSAGACDVVEICDGVSRACPADAKRPRGSVCRGLTGTCDVAEACDGVSSACPPDARQPAGAICRIGTGVCDPAELCDGVAASCPPDARQAAGTICRVSAGGCDPAEACDGTAVTCPPDGKQPADTVCRASGGDCDLPESCDGVSDACPPDLKQPASLVCRAAFGMCDASESCDGASDACPPDLKQPATTVCQVSGGLCDPTETCDGVLNDCPADRRLPAGTVCWPSRGPCDAEEVCDGAAAACPADRKKPLGSACGQPRGPCDLIDRCDGETNTCVDIRAQDGTICFVGNRPCDALGVCIGGETACPVSEGPPMCQSGNFWTQFDGKRWLRIKPVGGPRRTAAELGEESNEHDDSAFAKKTDGAPSCFRPEPSDDCQSSPYANSFAEDAFAPADLDAVVSGRVEGVAELGALKALVTAAASSPTAATFDPNDSYGRAVAVLDWRDSVTITSDTLPIGAEASVLLRVELHSTFINNGGQIIKSEPALATASAALIREAGSCPGGDAEETLCGKAAAAIKAAAPVDLVKGEDVVLVKVGDTLVIQGHLETHAIARLTGASVQVTADARNTARVRLVPLTPGVSYVTASGRGPYLPDAVPPVAGLEGPPEGAAVRGTIVVTTSATDDLTGVARLELTANGAPAGICTRGGPCQLEVNTTAFPDGPLELVAVAHDFEGNASPATRRQLIVDNGVPVLTVPPSIEVAASSSAGAVVDYQAQAMDGRDGALAASCIPSSGQLFPPGTTTVVCTATDTAGNGATVSFPVTVTFSWSGVLPPVNANGSSTFKLGSTVPVKFQLTGASAAIENLAAALFLTKLTGSEITAVSTAAAGAGNQFRYDGGQYIFNLSTKGLTIGTWQLRIDMGDGVSRLIVVSLR